ncbi:hypothetical protein DRQ50_06335 [bacterium]|nr:MAG: hypothetical protein DRQ50_06335 [bacterium]
MILDLVELGQDGFLRGGEPWTPAAPFYAVIGDPVSHSLSPRLHNAGMEDRELATEYVALHVTAERLPYLKQGGFARHLAGFNVTAPHKEAVAILCDGRTDQARSLGAVNTVKVEDGSWLGHNTDSGGVVAVLSQAWPEASPPDVATVLGAGGSARAAVDALARWGVPRIQVRNRSQAGRDRFAKWLAAGSVEAEVAVEPLVPGRPDAPDGAALWICCLAGGVATDPFLPVAAGNGPSLLLDLRYGEQLPSEAPPLGFQHVDGLPVLMMQGGLAFAWWFGPPVPWTAFQAALAMDD